MKRLLALAILLVPAAVSANPKALPYTYGYPTTPAGDLELEQYIDVVPMKVARELANGDLESTTALRYDLQTEFEIGITDRLELGFYLVARQGGNADAPQLRLRGIKQRIRYRFAEAGEWPVDVGVYLEIAEYFNELEFEQKLLLSKRFDRLVVSANLWVEQEYYFTDDDWKFIYNPSIGASYELAPAVAVGLEYWMRGRFDDVSPAEVADGGDVTTGTRHYLGPTVRLQKGEYWMTVGAYARLDALGDAAVVGDPFGKMSIRVILGLGL
jgi:opacity protein-like surface antigen